MPSPPAERTIHAHLYSHLRTQIMHGLFPPAQKMTLRGLADTYQCSMTPTREATRRLVAEGALSMGASGRVMTPVLSPERIEELTTLRSLLEPELAARALPRAHSTLIERLETIDTLGRHHAAQGDMIGYIRGDIAFHRTLYLRAQAPAMLAIVETLWLQLGPTLRQTYERLKSQRLPPQSHGQITAALKAGDEPGLRLAVRADVMQILRLIQR